MLENKKNIMRIKLSSHCVEKLNTAVEKIMNLARRENLQISGPVPLPNKTKSWVLPSSPHVYKRARDTYDLHTYYRMLDLTLSNPDSSKKLLEYELIPEVDCKIKLLK